MEESVDEDTTSGEHGGPERVEESVEEIRLPANESVDVIRLPVHVAVQTESKKALTRIQRLECATPYCRRQRPRQR